MIATDFVLAAKDNCFCPCQLIVAAISPLVIVVPSPTN